MRQFLRPEEIGIWLRGSVSSHAASGCGSYLRFGTSAKASLERAAAAAAGARQIQPTHLLLGVLGAQHGTVPRMLALAGVDRAALTEQVRTAIDRTAG